MHGEERKRERKKEREKKVCEYNDTFDVRWRMQATCVYHFPTYNVSLSAGKYSNCHKQFVSLIHLGTPATYGSLRNCPYNCRPWQFEPQ